MFLFSSWNGCYYGDISHPLYPVPSFLDYSYIDLGHGQGTTGIAKEKFDDKIRKKVSPASRYVYAEDSRTTTSRLTHVSYSHGNDFVQSGR
jgi:hypothetical protein